MSGADDLNVEWTSTATSITWNWDPVANREDRGRIDHWACMTNTAVTSPAATDCETVPSTAPAVPSPATTVADNTWANLEKNISASAGGTVAAGQVRTVRIVRTWMEDLGGGLEVRRFGTPAVVMAATSPLMSTVTNNPALTESTTRLEPTRIEWAFEVDPGFSYPGVVLSVSREDDLPAGTSDNPCSGGKSVASPQMSGRPNVDVRHRETLNAADAYKQFRFCARAENDDGASAWAIIGTDGVETIPGKPSKPTYDSSSSESDRDDTGSDIVTRVVWSIAENPQTPSRAEDPSNNDNYNVLVYRSSSSSITTDVCATGTSPPTGYTNIAAANVGIEDTLGGTQVTATGTPAADLLGAEAIGTYYLHTCVRAAPGADIVRAAGTAGGSAVTADQGPWEIGRSAAFRRALGTSSLRAANLTGGTTTRLTWSAVNGVDGYAVYPISGTSGQPAPSLDLSSLPSASCTVQSTDERVCEVTRPSSGSPPDYYWVVASAGVSGSTLLKESNRVTVSPQ